MAASIGNNKESIDKPCRVCKDFKSWTKLRRKQEEAPAQEETPGDSNSGGKQKECPLSRDELGHKTWGFLHTMAAYYPENPTEEQKDDVKQFMKLFARFYPCNECAEDLRNQIERFPPKTDSQQEFSQWLCRIHNRINLRLGKPIFDCSEVNERWRDGWKDGSCD